MRNNYTELKNSALSLTWFEITNDLNKLWARQTRFTLTWITGTVFALGTYY